MPYVKRNRPDLDTRPERRYTWLLLVLLLAIVGVFLVSQMTLGW